MDRRMGRPLSQRAQRKPSLRFPRSPNDVHTGTAILARLVGLVTLVALAGVATLASTIALEGLVPTPAVAAQQSARRAPVVPAAARLTNRVTLADTSIDGPGFAAHSTRAVLAWTGTDAAHHLNVETSKDGLHFSNQRIPNETSPFRPDVTQIGEPAGGNVTVAWTGSDANRSLNVLFDVYGKSPKKLTLSNERSRFAPALVQRGETLFLAWTGTDAQQQLNILPITIGASGLVPGNKSILGLLSSAGPHLTVNQGADVVLSWTSRARDISLAASSDGVHFPTASGINDETSAFAPSTTSLPAGSGPNGWIGWAGTDPVHHLNLQSTTNFPVFLHRQETSSH